VDRERSLETFWREIDILLIREEPSSNIIMLVEVKGDRAVGVVEGANPLILALGVGEDGKPLYIPKD